jgi:hypothetical protein
MGGVMKIEAGCMQMGRATAVPAHVLETAIRLGRSQQARNERLRCE